MHYKNQQFQAAKMAGLFDDILKTVATVMPFVQGNTSGGGSGAARGLAAITAATKQIIDNMRQLALTPNAQTLAQAQELRAILDNHNAIYPAKKGKDAEVLNRARSAADAILVQMRNAVATVKQPTTNGGGQTVTLPNGETVVIPNDSNNEIINGIDNKYLLIGGGLIAAFLLARR